MFAALGIQNVCYPISAACRKPMERPDKLHADSRRQPVVRASIIVKIH
jgi:hypothetical protein